MRLVLGTKALTQFGGSETYLLTVAEQLQRLGHDIFAYTPEPGDAARAAADRGIAVVSQPAALPPEIDGALAQDGATAYQLADRYPHAARVYVAHSTFWEPQRPPQLDGVCHAVVVLNDRVKARCEALARPPRLVRLTQPINPTRLTRLGKRLANPPRRVLAFGNQWGGARFAMLESVCGELGLELENVGAAGRMTATPELEIAAADVVIGVGRCVIEAMAAGRAAYVYGVHGGDGWVTPDTYEALEADGFGGRATDAIVDAARLRSDLERFDPGMGQSNRDLVTLHHRVAPHAGALVELFRSIEPRPPEGGAVLPELARLVRIQWEAEVRTGELARRANWLAADRDRWRDEYDGTATRLRELHEAYNRLLATRRWRLARLIGAPADLVRWIRRRRRGRGG